MTRSVFIRLLKNKGYSYEIEGDKIVVTNGRSSSGDHAIFEIRSIPSGVVFKNRGSVYLGKLTSLPPGVVFENRLNAELDSLISLHPGVEFKNRGDVYLISITGNWFKYWKGNIEGIGTNRLLNKMISIGLFDR